ncbi:FAD-dependent oxidoreductase [Comamonas sp. JNW]|uniref:FAD-dependent oxidoreductase n=1 Tax=Comamonas sp. JNW TaxID=2170731 RepID=UPI001FAEFCC5|nr:FAD-dependent oxidoreductase [Comamonas sp. JNW]
MAASTMHPLAQARSATAPPATPQHRGIPVWRHIGATPAASRQEPRASVVIAGAGPVGLAMALDLARRGHEVVVISRLDFVPGGSKAICFSKRSLDIFERLGVGQTLLDKGVTWNVGKVFWGARAEPIYQFDMLPIKDQQYPGFINIQQYYVEEALLDALRALPNVKLRLGQNIESLQVLADHVRLGVQAGAQHYTQEADWLIACDGSKSTLRGLMGLDFNGRVFEENFLIADIRMPQERPAERWFWFDPPFNPGQSALMHRQPDGLWRLDFQLGWGIDREACAQPENVERYVRAMLGPGVPFTTEWHSIYTFQCRRMDRFVHGRVLFAGDSAHLVSPFGARGCNGGLADTDNLGWKLDRVLRGESGQALLESYNDEAIAMADENILHSSRSTDFLTPKSAASRALRNAVLELAARETWARPFVNSGRLSTAIPCPHSALNTADDQPWEGGLCPGAPAVDAPLAGHWLLPRLGGRFVLLAHQWHEALPAGVELLDIAALGDTALLQARYALAPGCGYLIRPDQYVAARFQAPVAASVLQAALDTACACDSASTGAAPLPTRFTTATGARP